MVEVVSVDDVVSVEGDGTVENVTGRLIGAIRTVVGISGGTPKTGIPL